MPRVAKVPSTEPSMDLELGSAILVEGVRENNLKNITVSFPAGKLTVLTGVSGSGKSTLAFDTLYAEGQRRYIESLSTYIRQFLEKMPKPELDAVHHIPPAIALEQKNHVFNARSTVGTQTELLDHLRVLWARIGRTHCLHCGVLVEQINATYILDWVLTHWSGQRLLLLSPLGGIRKNTGNQRKKGKKPKAKTARSRVKRKARTAPAGVEVAPLTATDWILEAQRRGFRRIALPARDHELQVYDLEEEAPSAEELEDAGIIYAVVDRLQLDPDDADQRPRLLDSIEQAMQLGHQQVAFYSVDQRALKAFTSEFSCPACGRCHETPVPALLSFNSPLGACSICTGFGHTLDLDEDLIVPNPDLALGKGAVDPFTKMSQSETQRIFFSFARSRRLLDRTYRSLTTAERALVWEGDGVTYHGIRGCFEDLKRKSYKLHVRVFIRRYQEQHLCKECHGTRLKPEARAVRIAGRSLPEVLALSIQEAQQIIFHLELCASEEQTVAGVLSQVRRRLDYLVRVGVGYLTLERLTRTLSGGEFQRINLATQLGNGLCGTLYVLDEPSIGLHPQDTQRLIGILQSLRDQGNTLVVVEHDLEIIRAADWLVELGPQAGRFGGSLVACGTALDLQKMPHSLTGRYLSGRARLDLPLHPREAPSHWLELRGCRMHNLKNCDVRFPLERLVVVTGVSGSGKSTLVNHTLYRALKKHFEGTKKSGVRQADRVQAGGFAALIGAEHLKAVALLDQSAIGKSSRSNPATYLKAWDEIRKIFAAQPAARLRNFTPATFSFNVEGGRCPVCEGEGEILVDMHFMAEVKLPCQECQGRKFRAPVLEITYQNRNVEAVLHMTAEEAWEFFADHPVLRRKFEILRRVGLGYLQLGQSAATLSGGEAQRLKIASVLNEAGEKRTIARTLYIFDEPTTGLHLEDIQQLLLVIRDLVDRQHSVILIEHHLDVIAGADWVIDVGPAGGEAGGEIVAADTPRNLARQSASITSRFLKDSGLFADN